MAAADKVDVEFVSNIKELFMKQNKKLWIFWSFKHDYNTWVSIIPFLTFYLTTLHLSYCPWLYCMNSQEWAIALLLRTPLLRTWIFSYHPPWNFHSFFCIFNHLHGNSTYLFDPFPWKFYYIALLTDHPMKFPQQYFHGLPWNFHNFYCTFSSTRLLRTWFFSIP